MKKAFIDALKNNLDPFEVFLEKAKESKAQYDYTMKNLKTDLENAMIIYKGLNSESAIIKSWALAKIEELSLSLGKPHNNISDDNIDPTEIVDL